MLIKINKLYLTIIFIIIFIFIFIITYFFLNFEKYKKNYLLNIVDNDRLFSLNNNYSFLTFDEYKNELYSKIDFLSGKNYFKLNINSINNIHLNDTSLKELTWKLPLLNYYESDAKPSGFLDTWKNNLIIFSGDGSSMFIDLDILNNFDENNIPDLNLSKIKNNLTDIIKDESFYFKSWIGVKDILVDNDNIYISYNKLVKSVNPKKKNRLNIVSPEQNKEYSIDADKCYGIGILKAKINFNYLEFEDFFSNNECIETTLPEFTAHLVGGRIVKYKDNTLLFSTGDYRSRKFSQDDNSIFGKILKISTLDKTYNIFSKGHRNPQGLHYDNVNDLIISTEHGPWGGDEINIISQYNNFGWPISSYGKHYCEKKVPLSDDCKAKYKNYPLHKNHIKYGFIEPLKFYNPSIGISEIVKLPKNHSSNKLKYLVSSLGGTQGYGRSYYIIELSNNSFNLLGEEKFSSSERVRDLAVSDDGNFIFVLKEDSPSLSIIF